MIQDRNITNSFMTYIGINVTDFFMEISPFMALALVLVLVDTRFGSLASKKRGEEVRLSRQWRRALNKMVDYSCWVLLAGMFGDIFGKVIGIPTLSIVLLLVIYSIELSSCINNYFEYKGINKKFNLFAFLGKNRFTEALEDKEKKN